MGLSLCNCQQAHVPALREFFARVYRPDYVLARSEAFFEWQFGNDEGACFKLALESDRVVGCLGYIPVSVNFGDQQRRGAWTANWMVDPEHRGLAIGPLLMRALMDQFDVTLAVGLSDDALRFLPKLGWTDVGRLKRSVCVLDPNATARLTAGGRLPLPASRITHAVEKGTANTTSVRQVSRFDERVNEFWDNLMIRQSDIAGGRRDAAALNQRYVGHPEFEYLLFEVDCQNKLTGFAVLRIEQVRDLPIRVGRIVELVVDNASEEPLVSELLEHARGREAAFVDFYCRSSRLDDALRKAGFVSDPQVTELIPSLFQPLSQQRTHIDFMAYLARAELPRQSYDWYVTKSDGDQDRPN